MEAVIETVKHSTLVRWTVALCAVAYVPAYLMAHAAVLL